MGPTITRYQGPNLKYHHGLPEIVGKGSNRAVHTYINAAGGKPFGHPIEYGVTSLSSMDKQIFRQLEGYHLFDSYERVRRGGDHMFNKFTMSAAVNFGIIT